MLIFDFFAGTKSSTQAFQDNGHTVISFEYDEQFDVTEQVDIFTLKASELMAKYGRPDFIWASPPCTAFSVASIGHHWAGDAKHKTPKTEYALVAQNLVAHTLSLINELNPKYGWLMENPRGILRKLDVVAPFKRHTVTYCQYGETRMKPTDLWGGLKAGSLVHLAKMVWVATKQHLEVQQLELKELKVQRIVLAYLMN